MYWKLQPVNNLTDEIEEFLSETLECKQFTYYQKRPFQKILSHKYCVILVNDRGVIGGYGHLDYEKYIWLGIYIGKKFRGKKLSRVIMNDLITSGKNLGLNRIHLSVYKTNKIAIESYKKQGFKEYKVDKNSFYMKMEL